jgi:hypothetical protein
MVERLLIILRSKVQNPPLRPVANVIKLFFGIIYATRGIFSFNLDLGYANSNVIKPK